MSDFNATKYKNDFNKEAYDRASINFPKGQKAVIETHYKARGYKSLNAYINDLIKQDMEAGEKQKIHVHDNNGKVIVGDINGNVNM